MICDVCKADAPNARYCVNCGAMRKEQPKPKEPLKIARGQRVAFDYYGKERVARIKKVLRVNVEVTVISGGKRKIVRIPVKEVRSP